MHRVAEGFPALHLVFRLVDGPCAGRDDMSDCDRNRLNSAGLISAAELAKSRLGAGSESMKHYRVNKLAKPGGVVIKKKDVLAANDRQAVQDAADSDDCPVCDVLRDGKIVGQIT